MNSTSEQFDGDQPDQRESTAGPYGYSIGIFLAVIVFLMVITYTYYHIYAKNHHNPAAGGGNGGRNSINHPSISNTDYDHESPRQESSGLDEEAIHAYPELLYSKVKDFKGGNSSTGNAAGCSICLQDYKDVDVLRILSECGHLFHQKCVDPWLRIHPTCPICRNFPTPSTPEDTSAAPPAVASESEIFV